MNQENNKEMANLKDKVIWITGASSGIGEALTYAAVAEGAQVIISARREEELKRVADNCKVDKNRVFILSLDLEHSEHIEDKVNQIISKFGRIDILINNGGIAQRSIALKTQMDVERKIMEINFFGTVALTKTVAKVMQKQKSGKLVVVTSILGKFGLPLYTTYAASKHALYGYFESLREELHPDNIDVLIVSPGFINTDVGIKSLTENGSEFNKKSPAQKNGMDPKDCAKAIINAIKGNNHHKYIGNYEVFSVYVKQFFPKIFYKLMRRMTKK